MLSACWRSSESRLVGQWQAPVPSTSVVFRFRHDHTFEVEGFNASFAATGRGMWHLTGDKLYLHPPTVEPWRYAPDRDILWTIVSLTGTEMRVKAAGDDIVRTYKRIQ